MGTQERMNCKICIPKQERLHTTNDKDDLHKELYKLLVGNKMLSMSSRSY